MIIKRINRTKSEQVKAVVFNNTGGTRSVGEALCFDLSSDANADGVKVVQPSTAGLQAFAGVVIDNDIPDQEYGLVLIYGAMEGVSVDATLGTASRGEELTLTNGSYSFTAATAAGDDKAFGVVLEEAASGAVRSVRCYIKGL